MGRAPFQVVVPPFRRTGAGDVEYAVFRRADDGAWQGIAGGGEDDETPARGGARPGKEGGVDPGVVLSP